MVVCRVVHHHRPQGLTSTYCLQGAIWQNLPNESHPGSRSNPGRPRGCSELVSAHLNLYDVWQPQFLGVHLKIKVDTCGEGNYSSPRTTQQYPVSIGPDNKPSAAARHPAANRVTSASPAASHPPIVCPVPPGLGSETAARGRADGRDAFPGSSLHAALRQQVPDILTREPDELVRQAGDVTNSSWEFVCFTSAKHMNAYGVQYQIIDAHGRHEPVIFDYEEQCPSSKTSLQSQHPPNCPGTTHDITTPSAAVILPGSPFTNLRGWMHILVDLIAQLSSTLPLGCLPVLVSGTSANEEKLRQKSINSMLFEFLWFHITSRIFSHRYVMSKTMLIPDKLCPKPGLPLASLTPAGFMPDPAAQQNKNSTPYFYEQAVER